MFERVDFWKWENKNQSLIFENLGCESFKIF